MKFELKQEKFQELLEKLIVKDIFPSCVFTTKEGKLFSVQKEIHGRALRFVKFNKSYFDKIDNATESIEIDIDRTLNIVKNIPAGTPLIVETVGNKLSVKRLILDKDGKVTGEKGFTRISFKDPEGEVKDTLPFKIKNEVPLIGETEVPLDVFLTIKLSSIKDISAFASSLKTEFYRFFVNDGKISVRVGDLHDFSDYHNENLDGKVLKGVSLEVTLSYGIPEIADTFRQEDVIVKTGNNAPAWIYEITDDYTLGILIPPYTESEE